MDVIAVLIYIILVKADIGEAAVREALRRIAPSRTEEFMTSWVQAYVDQGEAKGRREMLHRLLRRRFGEVRGDIAERIRAANVDQLDEWSECLLDAKTFEDVFGADRRH